ncbi:rhombosortase [Oceaniserpentilla sp. 4NH20-0058]|uniref:rhombosortase n=1 Tax=Oceaniserpentilla sp. 4NH20-0058 TaxID=3127660 RepID=UPI003104DDB5
MFTLFNRYSLSVWPLVFAAFVLLLVASNPWLKSLLRYDEGAIAQGEYWRLLTAHFMHLGWIHGLLNGLGFLLLAAMNPAGRVINWLLFYLASSFLISIYIMFESGTYYYVGASGVLHGLFILGAYFSQSLDLWRRHLLMLIIIVKLFWEQSGYYQDTGVSAAIGGHVYVDAHLIGGLCGLALVCVFLVKNRLKFPTYH